MLHARSDYNRIQDPAGLIPADEPVFLIRAQDRIGAGIVWRWADLNDEQGGDPRMSQMARDHAMKMELWKFHKLADLPNPETRGS